jgi:ribonucleoside-diphosphate reductase alpha chain
MPAERASITHKFTLAGHEGYITVGLYPNGAPGEIFIRMAKEGSTISGLMDSFATAISMCLQHGVPLKLICEKFAHTRFEPSGWTGNAEIGYAKSIMDYLFRWMQLRFLSGTQLDLFAGMRPATTLGAPGLASETRDVPALAFGDADPAALVPASHEPTSTTSGPWPSALGPESLNDRRPPQQGIAPDLNAHEGLSSTAAVTSVPSMQDRGIFHAATAMKEMYDMGDSPSCSTCGAIMTRNGACYRCMECGSTSGCS